MKLLSLDAESNGLYGQAFMISAIVTNGDGLDRLVAQFVGRCPIEGEVDQWVADNVLPNVADVSVNYDTYAELLEGFFEFYQQRKAGTKIVTHMAYPVETKVLRDMVELDLTNRQWEGPYPLFDVANYLEDAGFDPTSVDSYNNDHGLKVPDGTTTHNPLYDSWAAEVCFRHLKNTN